MSSIPSIPMLKLTDFYKAHGYATHSTEYNKITRLIHLGHFKAYAQGRRTRYITEETMEQILDEIPPPADAEPNEEIEPEILEVPVTEAEDALSLDSQEIAEALREIQGNLGALMEGVARLVSAFELQAE